MQTTKSPKAGERTQTIRETKEANTVLDECLSEIAKANPSTRAEAAAIVEKHGFYAHKGGRHVGVIVAGKRLAMVTHPTAADFN